MTHPFEAIIQAGDFDHYGVRMHRGRDAVVGVSLGRSYVWDDGKITDEQLPGISTIKVTVATLENVLSEMDGYAWADEPLVLVGGNKGEWGTDDGEYIIVDNICLAVSP